MSLVPQATHGGVTPPLFGGHAVSPHIENASHLESASGHAENAGQANESQADRLDGGAEHAEPLQHPSLSSCSGDGDLTAKPFVDAESQAGSKSDGAAAPASRGVATERVPRSRTLRADACESLGLATTAAAGERRPLHRLAEVRCQQGVSERTMARRLGVDLKTYREMEDPTCDLTLSQLTKIQEALDVPIADLLEDHHALSRPVQERAKLLKVMKTAVALREAKINPRSDRMAQMLCEQLIDLMPELAEVSGWPQFGARRGVSAIGKVLQNPIDTSGLAMPE